MRAGPVTTIGLVSCERIPEPDPDEEPLRAALAAAGVAAEVVPWDGPAGEPAGLERLDALVLRSCWNVHRAPERFLAWLAEAARHAPVWNPPDVVRGNLHKGYLFELEARGVPVVPGVLVARGARARLDELRAAHGWDAFVVKPAVSAASFATRSFGASELPEGQAFLDALAAERDVLVQPCLPAFAEEGERALVWIDGELTHAVRKEPRFAGEDERVSGALPLEAGERELAERALAPLAERLLYARVDVVRAPDGREVVSELELIEPSLFLLQSPAALERLVGALRGLSARLTR